MSSRSRLGVENCRCSNNKSLLTGSLYGALLWECWCVTFSDLELCDKKEKLPVGENFGKEQNLGFGCNLGFYIFVDFDRETLDLVKLGWGSVGWTRPPPAAEVGVHICRPRCDISP